MGKYNEATKAMIRAEYKPFEFGYKKLAAKYGMKRDEVRAIILATNTARSEESMGGRKEPESKTQKEELEYYRTAAMFYEIHAGKLEAVIAKDVKKKQG